ncbi:MAG: hypothetical protein ACTSWW_09925 [Promethearchaeota archaeon]
MRKKLFTYVMLGVLVFSTFAFVYSPPDEVRREPLAAATPGILDVGDVLYYHFMESYYDEWDMEERWDDGVAMLNVTYTEVNVNITYDLYMQSEIYGGWEWILAPPEDQGIFDDYAYDAYGHHYTVSPDLASMVAANLTDDIDGNFLASTGCDTLESSYSGPGSVHTVELYAYNASNQETEFKKVLWVGSNETGIMYHYEESSLNKTFILELAGNEIASYPEYALHEPDTFGFAPGDTVDIFSPERMEDGGEEYYPEPMDDRFEENDDNESAAYINPNTVYGNLILFDDDYYSIWLNNGDNFHISLWAPPSSERYIALDLLATDGTMMLTDNNADDNVYLDFTATESREHIFCVFGDDDAWYGIESSIDGAQADDEFEENDDYTNPTELFLHGEFFHLGPLVQRDPDFYRFHLEGGQNAQIKIYTANGASITLYDVNPFDGTIINSDSDASDGVLELWIYAGAAGDFAIAVDGSGDYWYDLEIHIEYDYHDDHEESVFIQRTVEYVYHNTYTNEDVLIATQALYKDADMNPDSRIELHPMSEMGRVNLTNPHDIQGGGKGGEFFYKDINWGAIDFNAMFTEMGMTGITPNTGSDWVEVTATQDGMEFHLFAQQLPGLGTLRYINMEMYDPGEDRHGRDLTFVIDCSAGGMNETNPALGVDEGDWWEYVVQEDGYENKWGPGDNYWNQWGYVHYVKFTVTHIFALNHTTMGVIGSMERYSSDAPEVVHFDGFQPFLVWDTTDPVSFMTMGGHGGIDGPPVLLPAGVDWSTQETNMINMFASMPDGSPAPDATHFTQNTVRIRFDEEEYGSDYEHRYYQDIILDVNEFGMTMHLEMDERKMSREWDTVDEWGEERESSFVGFVVGASKGMHLEDDIASVTGVGTGDTFVWEQAQYKPAEGNDPGRDPEDKSYNKIIIAEVVATGDGSVVFLGSQFWQGPDDTEYHAHTWELRDEATATSNVNLWYLGSIRDGDIWTWFQSQIFDIGIADLSVYEADIIEMLNYGMELPSGVVFTAADITTTGRTFEISKTFDGEDHIMRFAVSPEGIMQDMFQGTKDSNGVWLEWSRNVLIEAPTGYATGIVWTEDMPDYTAGTDPGTDPLGGFEIPGYPLEMFALVGLFGLVLLTRKYRK